MFKLEHFLYHVSVKEMFHASVIQLLYNNLQILKQTVAVSSVSFWHHRYSEPKVRQLWKKLTTTEDLSHDDSDTTASLVDFGSIWRISTSGSFISAVIKLWAWRVASVEPLKQEYTC